MDHRDRRDHREAGALRRRAGYAGKVLEALRIAQLIRRARCLPEVLAVFPADGLGRALGTVYNEVDAERLLRALLRPGALQGDRGVGGPPGAVAGAARAAWEARESGESGESRREGAPRPAPEGTLRALLAPEAPAGCGDIVTALLEEEGG